MKNKTYKIKNRVVIAGIFFAITFNWSCKKGPFCNCFVPTGKPTEETRAVPYFEQIDVKDNINVFLSTGGQEQVLLQGGKNLITYISTDVSGGVLTLKNNNKCNWMRSYKKSIINAYITMPNITFITNEGVGNIKSTDTLAIDSFQIRTESAGDVNLLVHSRYINAHLFGSGDLSLAGTTGTFTCNFFSGTGFMYCDKLSSGYTFLSSATIGDCYVEPKGVFDVVIYRNGNVYYAGNPQEIHCKTYGKGQLMKE